MADIRRAQRERTRELLLRATVECLVEFGYAGTTTQRVQERAGLSRGALLHHFGSKADLFVAAIQFIAARQVEEIRSITSGVGDQGLAAVVAAFRAAMSGPEFLAGLELWMSARTDPSLHAALFTAERELGVELRAVFQRVAGDDERSRTRFETLMMLLRGIAVTSILRKDGTVGDEILKDWLQLDTQAEKAAR